MNARREFGSLIACVLLPLVTGCSAFGLRRDTSYAPQIDPSNFQATVDNPYYPLVPGTTYRYLEDDRGDTGENVITVTHDTKTIMGVPCLVVHDVVMKHGRVAEDTYDWLAQDKNGNVWYFGEATKEISAGGAVSTKGSWEAGINGAQPGIIMPAQPKPGEPYRQEYALGEAEDMGQIVGLGETVTVPAGTYTDCVKTKEWSLLEAGTENKWYAKGIGFVRSQSTAGEVVTLVSVTKQ
jgi:hypothetical protein